MCFCAPPPPAQHVACSSPRSSSGTSWLIGRAASPTVPHSGIWREFCLNETPTQPQRRGRRAGCSARRATHRRTGCTASRWLASFGASAPPCVHSASAKPAATVPPWHGGDGSTRWPSRPRAPIQPQGYQRTRMSSVDGHCPPHFANCSCHRSKRLTRPSRCRSCVAR